MNIDKYRTRIRQDDSRNSTLLHLTANEPYLSNTTREFLGSRLGDRYYFGGGDEDGIVDFQPSTFLGLKGVQAIATAATDAAKEMLGASIVNLGCLSGIHPMMCTIMATTEPGDVVMTVSLSDGGHFSTKPVVERMGRKHIFAHYNLKTLSFDAKRLADEYHKAKAKAFYMDASFYLNPHNLQEIRKALGHDALIIYDASHTVGLIMGSQFQDPFREGADVICANTHKTLPGPQKGMIAFRDHSLGEKANNIINSGLFSSPHTATTIALSVAILEMKEFGKAYAKQTIKNSNELAESLAQHGYELRKANTGRYSENHQVHLFTDTIGEYRNLYKRLLRNGLSVNFSNTLGGRMFIRIGTQEITRRGMKEDEMKTVARFIHMSLQNQDCNKEVSTFTKRFFEAHYSFDQESKI